jgi:rhamnosyltransferase
MATSAEPRTLALSSAAALDALSPLDRARACGFDNVCSCLRRAVWERHPFPETPIAEDLEWARDVLLAGWRLAYAPRAAVVHSHDRSARYELHRTYLLHQRLRRLFGVRAVPTRLRLARAVLGTAALHLALTTRDPRGRTPRGVARALALAVAWPLGQYLGARSADTGRELLRPAGV